MSGDIMRFPDTWEEFEREYGFNDHEELYTNGARLIPSFRVEQWLEHIAEQKKVVIKMDAVATGITFTPDKHIGKWEERSVFEGEIEQWQSARCSVCNKYHTTPYLYYFDNFNYCPNCGAKMEVTE